MRNNGMGEKEMQDRLFSDRQLIKLMIPLVIEQGLTILVGMCDGVKVSAVSEAAELFIPLGDLVDVAKETARLTKERDSVQRDIERGEAKLNNPGFTGKAPAQLVEQEREKLAVARDKLAKLNARIADLANM